MRKGNFEDLLFDKLDINTTKNSSLFDAFWEYFKDS